MHCLSDIIPWIYFLLPLYNHKGFDLGHTEGNQSWIFIGKTDGEAETPVLWSPDAKNWLEWKRPWCWERLKVGGEGDDRGWDGWMASPTQWTWVWVRSSSWWWTGRPGVLQSMRSQRFGHNWGLNWTKLMFKGMEFNHGLEYAKMLHFFAFFHKVKLILLWNA